MKIAVASGKGGTGKTTLATNLAVAIARAGRHVAYVDCDVEEPNGRIFLKPENGEQSDVTVPVPVVNLHRCTFCGDCSAACEFHAIAVLGDTVEVFPSLCHGCGACTDVCLEDAITETARTIGHIAQGVADGVDFYEGCLNVGEPLSPPITRALRKRVPVTGVAIMDAPPGTSCPVIEAIADTDFVILVTEPTPFGQNDLELAVGMVRELGLPHGVVINRSDIGDERTEAYCRREQIDVLMRIPYDRRVAEAYSRGDMMLDLDTRYEQSLRALYRDVANRVSHDGTGRRQR